MHYSAPPFVTLLRDAMGSQISVLKNAGWKSNRTAAECGEELNLAAKSQVKKLCIILMSLKELFATVPDSSINSWESWCIFNLRKNKHLLYQYYESVSLNVRNCEHITRTHDIT